MNLIPGEGDNRLVLTGVEFGTLMDGVDGLSNDSLLAVEIERYGAKGLMQISHA